MAQDWIATNYSEFIGKDEWPPNSPDLLDYHIWGVMLEHHKAFRLKPKTLMDEESLAVNIIYDTICYRIQLTRPYLASQKDMEIM